MRGFPSYRGQRHFPGLYWSSTTGGHVGFESWLERDHAMLLDFTPQVTGLLSQPMWLFWEDERGKQISHAPDYFARFEDGRGLLVDCRPLDRIDPRSAAKFAAAQTACEALGWGYRVVGEVDPVRMATNPSLATVQRLPAKLHKPSSQLPPLVRPYGTPDAETQHWAHQAQGTLATSPAQPRIRVRSLQLPLYLSDFRINSTR
ncbi:TnsA-like heteromeric transposase endonuclease subunit [Streptomyces rochei]|uniref:TnsA-like heteromeric transposase endonuclease subunit n=1 Tax=Streptomyces rochei TaxID=1928 RepID=UPI003F4C37D1